MCMYTKEADMWVSNLVHPFEVDISEHLIEFVFRNGGLYVLYCVNQSFWPSCAFNSGQHEIHVQYFTASNDFKFTQHFDSTLIVADLSSLTHKHPELQLVHITAAWNDPAFDHWNIHAVYLIMNDIIGAWQCSYPANYNNIWQLVSCTYTCICLSFCSSGSTQWICVWFSNANKWNWTYTKHQHFHPRHNEHPLLRHLRLPYSGRNLDFRTCTCSGYTYLVFLFRNEIMAVGFFRERHLAWRPSINTAIQGSHTKVHVSYIFFTQRWVGELSLLFLPAYYDNCQYYSLCRHSSVHCCMVLCYPYIKVWGVLW